MHAPAPTFAVDTPAEGVSLKQLDDLCLVHFSGGPLDAARTSRLAEQLLAFLERGGCRKLLITFDKDASLNDSLLEGPPASRLPAPARREPELVGSDHWLG